MVFCGGAEPTTRPGCEKASSLEDLPQMLPIACQVCAINSCGEGKKEMCGKGRVYEKAGCMYVV